MHPILILTVDLTLSKRRKRKEKVTAGWTAIRTKEQKDDRSVFVKWEVGKKYSTSFQLHSKIEQIQT
jgi:hypothetical protein